MEKEATILVVDDEKSNRTLLAAILQEKYKVIVAKSGIQALERIGSTPPDLILLDIFMPSMDGYQVCIELKSQKETASIPIIFLTGRTEPEKIIRGFQLGAVDYVTKPFHPEELLSRIATHVELKKAHDTIQTQNRELQTVNQELTQKNKELEEALANINTLRGLLPICANCKKIRDDGGYWDQLENYFTKHSEILFSHSICPSCAMELYGLSLEELQKAEVSSGASNG